MISTGHLLARCTAVPLPSFSLLNPVLVPILLFSSPHSSSKINPSEARRKEAFHKKEGQPTTWISSARQTWNPFTFHTTNSIFRNTPHFPKTEIHFRQHPFTVMGGKSESLNSSLRSGDTTSFYYLQRISIHIDILHPHRHQEICMIITI